MFWASLSLTAITTCLVSPAEAVELRNFELSCNANKFLPTYFRIVDLTTFANRSLTWQSKSHLWFDQYNHIITIRWYLPSLLFYLREWQTKRSHNTCLTGNLNEERNFRNILITVSRTKAHSNYLQTFQSEGCGCYRTQIILYRERNPLTLPVTTTACSNAGKTFPLFVTCEVDTVWADILRWEGSVVRRVVEKFFLSVKMGEILF